MRCQALIIAAFAVATAAPAIAQTPTAAQPVQAVPASLVLFEQDWVLKDWALRNFDADKDVILSADEAAKAAAAFKQLADGDGDGRVTRDEFRRGRAFILARY